jgi:hypothetical protein
VGRISRRAADEIKRTVQIVKGLAPGGSGFAPVGPLFQLAKTTTTHVAEETEDVDIYVGAKGEEVASGQTVKAYNRSADLEDDVWVHIQWVGDGWEIIGGRASLTILGPCAAYTPAVELGASDFEVDFGGGCDGPNRFGLILRNLDTNITSTINLEQTTGLNYESASFSYSCASSTKTLTAELAFSSLDVDGAVLTFLEAASPIATYKNSIYRFFPLVGGYVQVQTSPCDCVTLPYDVCIAPPTR